MDVLLDRIDGLIAAVVRAAYRIERVAQRYAELIIIAVWAILLTCWLTAGS